MRKSIYFVLLLLCSTNIYAGIRPSFYLDSCSWEATDIIVVTQGKEIDGNFTVVESLKGDLQTGETVSVPELALFRSKSSRQIKDGFNFRDDSHPKYVSGSRMILFLKRKPQPTNVMAKAADAKPPSVWEAASREGLNVSIVWIEGEQSFAFTQVINPGPSILTEYGRTEKQIKDRTLEVMQTQESLNRAISIPDNSGRAGALVAFASSDLYLAKNLAFEEFQKCGDAALPVLRTMLNDNSKLELHGNVIKSMAEIGGQSVGSDLTEIVREEMLYWKATAPRLKGDWWNAINDPETEILRDHYMKAYQALRSLKTLKFAASKEVVTMFRNFWRSLPQLEDKSGLDQMSKECDNLLRELIVDGVRIAPRHAQTLARRKKEILSGIRMPTEEFESLKNDPDLQSEPGPGGTLIFLDGDAYCVVGPEFVDLQESDCYAFGDTREQAIANYAVRKRASA